MRRADADFVATGGAAALASRTGGNKLQCIIKEVAV